jgi:hypothetical protein
MMNTVQKDQRPGTRREDPLIKDSAPELKNMAKPVGNFAGGTDFVLRFHDGDPVATDTGDQGGGQN